jgi:hypothetical protein
MFLATHWRWVPESTTVRTPRGWVTAMSVGAGRPWPALRESNTILARIASDGPGRVVE